MTVHLELDPNLPFLIVDPKESNVEAMKLNLRKIGFRNVRHLPSGLDAMNFVRTNRVNFILCRLKMPFMTGTELLSEMQNNFDIDRMPFMMFSEKIDEEDLALLVETGVDTYLTLPFYSKARDIVAAPQTMYVRATPYFSSSSGTFAAPVLTQRDQIGR